MPHTFSFLILFQLDKPRNNLKNYSGASVLEYAESQMVEEWKMLSWDFRVLKSISKLMMYHFIWLTITHKIYILRQSRQYFEDKFYIHVKVVISL